MTYLKDIYSFIDENAPYSLQESYDNSGMNVRFDGRPIERALIALDITDEIIEEAHEKNAQLIVTHHPVIFRAKKTLDSKDPAVKLCIYGISAVSAHTNFDSAVMNKLFCKKLDIEELDEPLDIENGVPFGCMAKCSPTDADTLAKRLKDTLSCGVVRYNDENKKISRIALCTGSGGSFLKNALAKQADALITGDVKHDVFIDAHNSGISVFDAGHFHTENIFCEYMRDMLQNKFGDVEFLVAESNRDILKYW